MRPTMTNLALITMVSRLGTWRGPSWAAPGRALRHPAARMTNRRRRVGAGLRIVAPPRQTARPWKKRGQRRTYRLPGGVLLSTRLRRVRGQGILPDRWLAVRLDRHWLAMSEPSACR